MEELLGWLEADPRRLLVIVAVAGVIALVVRLRSGGGIQRDDQRLFDSSQRARIHARAGNRCEHKPLLWLRCSAKGTHADHVYPHSRGGPTILANAQSLCATHNLRKSASVPSRYYIWRLERRRRKYFPAGEDPSVQWRAASLVR